MSASLLVPGDSWKALGFRVQGPGFRDHVSGFRVQGPGSRVHGSGFKRAFAVREIAAEVLSRSLVSLSHQASSPSLPECRRDKQTLASTSLSYRKSASIN